MVICVSAFTVGLSNFIEDAVGVKALGLLFPIGMVILLIGLLIAGISALSQLITTKS